MRLYQVGVEGGGQQEYSQLQHAAQPEEDGAGDHGNHATQHQELPTQGVDGGGAQLHTSIIRVQQLHKGIWTHLWVGADVYGEPGGRGVTPVDLTL